MTDTNTGRETTLDQYGDDHGPVTFENPPRVILNRAYSSTYRVPHDRSKIAGWTGIDPVRGRVYLSVRSHREHYFENYGGYAVSEKVLERANRDGVEWVVVWEEDRDRSFVWRLTDFLAADDVESEWTPTNDTQKALATERAVGIWDQSDPRDDRR